MNRKQRRNQNFVTEPFVICFQAILEKYPLGQERPHLEVMSPAPSAQQIPPRQTTS